MKTVSILLAIVIATMLTIQVPASPRLTVHIQYFQNEIASQVFTPPKPQCTAIAVPVIVFNENLVGRDVGSTWVQLMTPLFIGALYVNQNMSLTHLSTELCVQNGISSLFQTSITASSVGQLTFRIPSSGNFTIWGQGNGFQCATPCSFVRLVETWTVTTVS